METRARGFLSGRTELLLFGTGSYSRGVEGGGAVTIRPWQARDRVAVRALLQLGVAGFAAGKTFYRLEVSGDAGPFADPDGSVWEAARS